MSEESAPHDAPDAPVLPPVEDEYRSPFERAEQAAQAARNTHAAYGHLLSHDGRVAAAWHEATYEMLAAILGAIEDTTRGAVVPDPPDPETLNTALESLMQRYDQRGTEQ